MASKALVFFAGMGTTFAILGIGFGSGLMLAKTTMEPSASSQSVSDRLPRARVILPAPAEAAMPPQLPVGTFAAPEPPPPVTPVKEAQQAPEQDKQAERAERRKAEAEERARRKRYAERKARREAARLEQEQERRQQPSILAFGSNDGQRRGGGGFFPGN